MFESNNNTTYELKIIGMTNGYLKFFFRHC
jgi:hypothetical protein